LNNFSYGILASGALGMQCVVSVCKKQQVIFVLTDRHSIDIIHFCTQHSIPVFVGNPRNGKAIPFISAYAADVLLSINYLFIIEKDIICYPKQCAVNFHGSLLPKYRGRSPHIWAIINNETETGITAHLITEGCDEGEIIYQERIPIHPDATGADILEQFSTKYPSIVSGVIDTIEKRECIFIKQDETKATWFGKRSPEDGCINWNWHKERIYNWVRAQAKPYPGAFTFYKNEKIIIHNIEFSEDGFLFDEPNGKILSGGAEPVIKTPNGAVKLARIETATLVLFTKGEVLHETH
jgi:methionyl-tRNA formyltransferase